MNKDEATKRLKNTRRKYKRKGRQATVLGFSPRVKITPQYLEKERRFLIYLCLFSLL